MVIFNTCHACRPLRPTLNYHPVGSSLYDLGSAYEALGDQDKALECFKQSYSVSCALGGENYAKNKDSAKGIKKLQPDFFTRQGFVQGLQKQDCVGGNQLGSECRRLIFSHGNTSENLITLKQKIQNIVLNKIVTACHNYGWSDVSRTWGDYGVKSYINQTYLKGQLGDLGNEPENLEEAQMLCFESMNLGIMKSDKKPYKIAESFCRSNPELVKRIAKEHPEFFVDGSIVEACIRAIPQDKEFADLLKQNVRYMGMDRETARGTGRGI